MSDPKARVFVGSSTEGESICGHLQVVLEQRAQCEVTLWTQGVFRASRYTMESLVETARRSDFAVLVVTPDDVVESRGQRELAVRPNVVFELGLFMGVLGRERTFIIADRTKGLTLPSDLNGLTWLPYNRRQDGNEQAAVSPAALQIAREIEDQGIRNSAGGSPRDVAASGTALASEIDLICRAAKAQGWIIKTRSPTTLRLVSPAGKRHTFTLGEPGGSRARLRRFASQLRASGLRVSSSVRRPVEDSPL